VGNVRMRTGRKASWQKSNDMDKLSALRAFVKVAGGEKCLDIRVRSKAALAYDNRREAMQGFKFRIRQRLSITQRGDDSGIHLDHPRSAAMTAGSILIIRASAEWPAIQ
jgi:hypothetical protein